MADESPTIKATRFTYQVRMTDEELEQVRRHQELMFPPEAMNKAAAWLELHLSTDPTVITGRDWARGLVTEVQQRAEPDSRSVLEQMRELFAVLDFRWCDHGSMVEVVPWEPDDDTQIVRYHRRAHKLRVGEQCTGWPPQPAPRSVDEVAMTHYATGAYHGSHLEIAPDVVKRHEPKPYPDPIDVLMGIPLVVDESLPEGGWRLIETSTGVTLYEGVDGGQS